MYKAQIISIERGLKISIQTYEFSDSMLFQWPKPILVRFTTHRAAAALSLTLPYTAKQQQQLVRNSKDKCM